MRKQEKSFFADELFSVEEAGPEVWRPFPFYDSPVARVGKNQTDESWRPDDGQGVRARQDDSGVRQ